MGKEADIKVEGKKILKRRAPQHMKKIDQIMQPYDSSWRFWNNLATYVEPATKTTSAMIQICTPKKKKSVQFVIKDQSGFDM